MTIQKLPKIPFVVLLITLIIFMGCNSGTNAGGDTGTMEVLLHDAPANYDEVNVFIERVEVNNTESDEGWEVL